MRETEREYKRRHFWGSRCIHWENCRANGIHDKSKWYEHQPEAVIENESCKILWDFTVQTDHFITARRLDMILLIKNTTHAKLLTLLYPMTQE